MHGWNNLIDWNALYRQKSANKYTCMKRAISQSETLFYTQKSAHKQTQDEWNDLTYCNTFAHLEICKRADTWCMNFPQFLAVRSNYPPLSFSCSLIVFIFNFKVWKQNCLTFLLFLLFFCFREIQDITKLVFTQNYKINIKIIVWPTKQKWDKLFLWNLLIPVDNFINYKYFHSTRSSHLK